MADVIYKLRNGISVIHIPHTRASFRIITKNKELEAKGLLQRDRDIKCDGYISLLRGREENLLRCQGGAFGDDFDIVGYKRRPKPMMF